MKDIFGSIEAGGTKFVCAVGVGPEQYFRKVFPTTSPKETINKAIDFFSYYEKEGNLKGIGIGTFGPVNLDKKSEKYGVISNTPKLNWIDTNIHSPFQENFKIPIEIETDVNIAALGEYTWGGARYLNNFIYLTIGTGVGGAAIINGSLLKGSGHPEMGHIFLPKLKDDSFEGGCPYHYDQCFEGLVSGASISLRCGKKAFEVKETDLVWGLVAKYIALALVNYIYTLAPQKIVIGGGVMKQKHLLSKVRELVVRYLNGYNYSNINQDTINDFICAPSLGDNSGVLGGFVLAKNNFNLV